MDQIEDRPELQAEAIENTDVEDENEALYKWMIFAVFLIWVVSFLMF